MFSYEKVVRGYSLLCGSGRLWGRWALPWVLMSPISFLMRSASAWSSETISGLAW